MIISSIVAMGKNRVIGRNNQMMWTIPSEYKFYRDQRADHFFIIGRKNYEGSKELHQNEKAIILTRQESYQCDHPVFNDIEDAIAFARDKGESELFIIGGSEIYELAMPYIHRLYLSIVDFSHEGDAYFPEYENFEWKLVENRTYPKSQMEDTPISWELKILEKTVNDTETQKP